MNHFLSNQNDEVSREKMLELVEKHLTPLALKYRYSEIPLEANIKWKPLVLVLGNYSSGKSTLINEFLGQSIQDTGQAPTDDAFTVITYGSDEEIKSQPQRDGQSILYDAQFPFEALKRHGERFKSHFCMKKVNSPFLENLAIIDTPGMLDSISEKDRGYNYQQVIGDLAQLADLVLVLFDPHKAGTVQETYHSLRETLPANTYENRVVFVLNRIDECSHMSDLLRVYGTLCWNLSQMTGRKDIPKILLTHSSISPNQSPRREFLALLENQRLELLQIVKNAPKHRIDHITSFIENHGERLEHLFEALSNYTQQNRKIFWKNWGVTFLSLIVMSGLLGLFMFGFVDTVDPFLVKIIFAVFVAIYLGTSFVINNFLHKKHCSRLLDQKDTLTDIRSQSRKESWHTISDIFTTFVKNTEKMPSHRAIKKDMKKLHHVLKTIKKELRT